ncbi:MAG: radical SAM protein [Methanothrix sp.]|nr:radical SAM protein [Methanothrix sp.]
MKIVFILPFLRSPYSACPEPPLGLAYLAASLLRYRNDLHIEIIDGFLLERDEYYHKISKIKADVIGVTTTMAQLNEALLLPSIVKDTNTKFIIGGPGAVNLPSSKLYENGYSIICYGEGEKTIVELVEAFENGLPLKDIKGISYCSNGREIKTPPRDLIEDLDDIPFPARSLLDMERYLRIWKEKMGVSVTQIISSRGCPFSCRFCDNKTFGRKIRFMSPPRIIEEMKLIYDSFGAEMIYFEEDLFTINRKRVLDFCELMEKELPGRIWGAHSRVDTIDLEMLTRMKQAGCTDLFFGVESGSQKILDLLGKGFTVEKIENAFRLAKKVGIRTQMYLIIGIPGETHEDIEMTKRIIARLEPSSIDISSLTPIPGTEIYEMTKHLIEKEFDYSNCDLFKNIFINNIFEVGNEEKRREILDFFFSTFESKIDPRHSPAEQNTSR